MVYLWLAVFGLVSWAGEPQRLNLEQPNAWTWFLLLALASDLLDADASWLKRRFR